MWKAAFHSLLEMYSKKKTKKKDILDELITKPFCTARNNTDSEESVTSENFIQ